MHADNEPDLDRDSPIVSVTWHARQPATSGEDCKCLGFAAGFRVFQSAIL